MSYEARFLEAIERSERLGFAPPMITTTQPHVLNKASVQKAILDLMVDYLGNPPNPRMLIGTCLATHMNLRGTLEKIVNTKAFFTLGHVRVGNSHYHEFSENDVVNWMKHGIPDLSEFKGHAWLTLPSMEIVDFTFTPTATSISMRDTGDVCVGAIADYPSNLNNMDYHPVIVGEDIVSKIGAMGLMIYPVD